MSGPKWHAKKRPPAQSAEVRALVVRLMQAGCTRLQVLAEIAEQVPGASPSFVDKVYGETLQGWAEAYEHDRKNFKLMQIARLHGHIASARVQEKWGAVAALERLYAQVAGTLAPIRVEVDDKRVQREALIDVLYSLTDEELDEIAAEQAALEARAAQAAMLPRKLPAAKDRGGNGAPGA